MHTVLGEKGREALADNSGMQKKQSRGNVTRRQALGIGGIGVGAAAIGIGNYYANKYAPVINTYLGQKSYEVKDGSDGSEDSVYFKPSYSSESERLAADGAVGRRIAQEGFVLLKNEGGALPMAGGRVTLLGVSSASILYGGGGSGTVDSSTAPTLKDALESSGIEVNPTMWSFYTEGAASDVRMDVAHIAGTGR